METARSRALHEANRALRVHETNVPDLTASLIEEWDRARARRSPPRLARVGLALVGAANLLVAAMLLTGAGAGFLQPVAEHPGRELVAFSATLAAAFLISAIDGRARARLEVVGVAVALLVLTAAADVLSSHTHLLYEVSSHLANVVGFALLWVLSRFEPSHGSPWPRLRRHHEPESRERLEAGRPRPTKATTLAKAIERNIRFLGGLKLPGTFLRSS